MKKQGYEQKKYWDSVADKKIFTIPLKIDLFKKYVSTEASILDVGCGYGRTLCELKQNGYNNLTGVDFSLKMIERGERLYPDITFRVVNNSFPFAEQSMDTVILFAVLTCIEKNREQKQLINRIRSILKSGGIIYINDFLLNGDKRNKARYSKYEVEFENYGTFRLPEGAIVRHHNKDWILELLKDFTMLEFEETEYVTMNGNISKGFYYIGKME